MDNLFSNKYHVTTYQIRETLKNEKMNEATSNIHMMMCKVNFVNANLCESLKFFAHISVFYTLHTGFT